MKQSARQTMPSLSRRTFVTAAAATGAAAAVGLSGCAPKAEDKPAEQGPAAGEDPFADCELVYGCCSPECQHHLLKGYVRDGKLVKVESGEVNECPACGKGFARVEMCNSDKRLTKPLKLVGAKGSGECEEISWDEAIDLIEEKINYAPVSYTHLDVYKRQVHVLGGGGAEPDAPVLFGGEAEGTHVGLVVFAGGQVPRGHARQVGDDGLGSGLFHG